MVSRVDSPSVRVGTVVAVVADLAVVASPVVAAWLVAPSVVVSAVVVPVAADPFAGVVPAYLAVEPDPCPDSLPSVAYLASVASVGVVVGSAG
jgi:hypothetical protein